MNTLKEKLMSKINHKRRIFSKDEIEITDIISNFFSTILVFMFYLCYDYYIIWFALIRMIHYCIFEMVNLFFISSL